MALVTIMQARLAKAQLQQHLASAGIAATVGISGNGSNFCLEVRVPRLHAGIPERVNGVDVRVEVTGGALGPHRR